MLELPTSTMIQPPNARRALSDTTQARVRRLALPVQRAPPTWIPMRAPSAARVGQGRTAQQNPPRARNAPRGTCSLPQVSQRVRHVDLDSLTTGLRSVRTVLPERTLRLAEPLVNLARTGAPTQTPTLRLSAPRVKVERMLVAVQRRASRAHPGSLIWTLMQVRCVPDATLEGSPEQTSSPVYHAHPVILRRTACALSPVPQARSQVLAEWPAWPANWDATAKPE